MGARLRNIGISIRWYIEAFRLKRLAWLLAVVLVLWLLGATIIWAAENAAPEGGKTWRQCVWYGTVYLVSGLDEPAPVTRTAKMVTVFMMLVPGGVLVLFGGALVATFTERLQKSSLVRVKPASAKFRDHVVICGWSEKGDAIVRELHSEQFRRSAERRPIVIVAPAADEIAVSDPRIYRGVWAVRGDPVLDEVLQEQADIGSAHSAIVLAAGDSGSAPSDADAKTILVSLAIQAASTGASATGGVAAGAAGGGDRDPGSVVVGAAGVHTCAEVLDRKNEVHFERTAVQELICVRDIAAKLIGHAAQKHNLTDFFLSLLEVSSATNEVYFVDVPPALVGRSFGEAQRLLQELGTPNVVLVGARTGALKTRDGVEMLDRFGARIPIDVLTVNPPLDFDAFGDLDAAIAADPESLISTRFFSTARMDDHRIAKDYRLAAGDRLVVISMEEPDLSKVSLK